MQAEILIVGSLNMDFIVKVGSLPRGGETITGWGFTNLPGGKGANQACAVGRLDGVGRMVGCIGRDVHGEELLASLRAAGIHTNGVRATSAEATGSALITVERSGQNQIIVAAGANQCLEPGEVRQAIATARPAFLLLQLEVPLATVEAAARQAKAQGAVVILDPAPSQPLSATLLQGIDILTPNESEACLLLGLDGITIELDETPRVARALLALGPRCVVLKLGAKGVWLADDNRSRHFPARRVEAVDVTAAGDCFNGALAVALAEGRNMEQAIRFANCAAALTVTRCGAQASIPQRAEVEAFLVEAESKQHLTELV